MSVSVGLEASSSGSNKGKCKAVETDRPRKRPKLWFVDKIILCMARY